MVSSDVWSKSKLGKTTRTRAKWDLELQIWIDLPCQPSFCAVGAEMFLFRGLFHVIKYFWCRWGGCKRTSKPSGPRVKEDLKPTRHLQVYKFLGEPAPVLVLLCTFPLCTRQRGSEISLTNTDLSLKLLLFQKVHWSNEAKSSLSVARRFKIIPIVPLQLAAG